MTIIHLGNWAYWSGRRLQWDPKTLRFVDDDEGNQKFLDGERPSCRPDFAVLCYSGYLKAKDKDELASGLRMPAGTPPIFLAHGGDDIISDPGHSVVTYLALKRAGVPAELHIYATAAHDFGVRPSDHPCSAWTQACASWLRHLGFLASSARP